ncbi:3-hydroxyacyl-CoA dehydrogenase [Ammoniphilus oxalaticus]|uniref:3-hydroxyacyl-CoA dehydrogenase n=1 Tax=Ammoniphilus oxalaticus TaxID=66863 RepID=A0A419SK67_9BACL|nr:3-hydroxyacyl-CoA dehydrogenase/enoyl-CoA hydratase family protein [Ammoniphilus oxalaticus]RKD24424.1 3-hydroxyacyl-CoA dehydrogenase [Ammoniphilus oxalaticus]
MKRQIKKVAVLGSGVMGAGIAAHLANVGLKVILLDRPIGEASNDRNQLTQSAITELAKQKPSPLYSKTSLERIQIGNFEDDLSLLGQADWIVEAVVEDLSVKRQLLAQVEKHRRPGSVISSNTSGISISKMAAGRSDEFRQHFLGTHFFNPPRYMKLLELIPTTDTSQEIISTMIHFSEFTLGKGVVIAKDTPNFIANRIGVYGLLATLEEMDRYGLSVSDVDQLTGTAIGRPRSATFRALDLVGLDTFLRVAENVREHVTDPLEKAVFTAPKIISSLVAQGHFGEKSGKGFYQKQKTAEGRVIHQLNVQTEQYEPSKRSTFACLEQAKQRTQLAEKIRTIAYAEDAGGQFVWQVLKRTLLYAAAKIPEISDDIVAVDQAMKWGFNWELGPFETWDALGLERSIRRMKEEGETIPRWVEKLVEAGHSQFYKQEDAQMLYVQLNGQWQERQRTDRAICLSELKQQGRVAQKNAGASLIDLGDGVACLEFHSPHNALGSDTLEMVRLSLEEVRKNYVGLVIGNQARNFSVGANLMMLLLEAQNENWFEIEQLVRQFQTMAMEMKYFEKPIVAAPYARTLGGGVEICLPAARVQAAAETYMGLVEVGVGLIPGGAGTKEMLVRAIAAADIDGKVDLQPYVNRVFETIAMAKVSTSAVEAQQLGYLRATDQISINEDHQLYEAKQAVIGLAKAGYVPPIARKIRVVGESGLAVMKLGVYQLKTGGYITEHDAKIAGKLASVLAGGALSANTEVSEQYLLDLEREAFLSLCGEPKSQARMQHMLLKNKPLRN